MLTATEWAIDHLLVQSKGMRDDAAALQISRPKQEALDKSRRRTRLVGYEALSGLRPHTAHRMRRLENIFLLSTLAQKYHQSVL